MGNLMSVQDVFSTSYLLSAFFVGITLGHTDFSKIRQRKTIPLLIFLSAASGMLLIVIYKITVDYSSRLDLRTARWLDTFSNILDAIMTSTIELAYIERALTFATPVEKPILKCLYAIPFLYPFTDIAATAVVWIKTPEDPLNGVIFGVSNAVIGFNELCTHFFLSYKMWIHYKSSMFVSMVPISSAVLFVSSCIWLAFSPEITRAAVDLVWFFNIMVFSVINRHIATTVLRSSKSLGSDHMDSDKGSSTNASAPQVGAISQRRVTMKGDKRPSHKPQVVDNGNPKSVVKQNSSEDGDS